MNRSEANNIEQSQLPASSEYFQDSRKNWNPISWGYFHLMTLISLISSRIAAFLRNSPNTLSKAAGWTAGRAILPHLSVPSHHTSPLLKETKPRCILRKRIWVSMSPCLFCFVRRSMVTTLVLSIGIVMGKDRP